MVTVLSFTFTGCNSLSREDETVTYTDSSNNAIWDAVYERLEDAECDTDYNMLREACSTLKGDVYNSKGEVRSGKRISAVEKSSFNDYTDIYKLTLTDSSILEFAIVNQLSDDSSAYDVFVENNPDTTLDEKNFIEKMAYADLYVTLTIDTNGGTYPEDTEYTVPIGTMYTLKTPESGDNEFLGWYKGADFTDKIVGSTISVDYDTTIYASWSIYNYSVVDYSEWDELTATKISYYETYYTESFRTSFSQFVADVNAKRGTLTQAKVDAYCAEYSSRLANGEFITSDAARVYLFAGSISKYWYTAAEVIVADKEGGTSTGFRDGEAKVKIRGNSTSNLDKKPYNIKLSSKHSLLGMVSAKKWSLLANAMDKTLMRNAVALSLAKDMGFAYASDYRVVEVFLNGKNLGCYMLVESIDVASNKVDIDLDNGDALLQLDNELSRHDDDVSYFFTGSPTHLILSSQQCFGIEKYDYAPIDYVNSVKERVDNVEEALATGDKETISAVMDLDSFVNYYLLLEYCKDIDATISSKWFYIKDDIIYAGPPWDFDLSMGNPSYSYYGGSGYFENYTGSHGLYAYRFSWFRELLKNSWFTALVTERLTELSDTITSYYTGDNNFIDVFVYENNSAINRNYSGGSGGAGWSLTTAAGNWERDPNSTYSANVTYLRTWLYERHEWLKKYYGAQ